MKLVRLAVFKVPSPRLVIVKLLLLLVGAKTVPRPPALNIDTPAEEPDSVRLFVPVPPLSVPGKQLFNVKVSFPRPVVILPPARLVLLPKVNALLPAEVAFPKTVLIVRLEVPARVRFDAPFPNWVKVRKLG